MLTQDLTKNSRMSQFFSVYFSQRIAESVSLLIIANHYQYEITVSGHFENRWNKKEKYNHDRLKNKLELSTFNRKG